MKWLIKSADLLSLSPCPSLKKSRHLKLAFNFRIYCCIFVANQRSHDLFITGKQNMRVLCEPDEEFVFRFFGSRFFRASLSRSLLTCFSSSSVAMARDEQLAAMLTACLSHISAYLSWVVSVRCSALVVITMEEWDSPPCWCLIRCCKGWRMCAPMSFDIHFCCVSKLVARRIIHS